MTAHEMAVKLLNCPQGTIVFGSYLAARPATLRARLEATKAEHEGYGRRYFYGSLERLFTNKKGEYCFTVMSECRYNLDNLKAEGNYRCFNPALGQLISLEVME